MGIAKLDSRNKELSHSEIEGDARGYRSFFEYAPVSFQSLDASGCFLDVNRAWLQTLGYERDEVIGNSFEMVLDAEDRQLFRKRFPQFKKNGAVHNVQFTLCCKDGTPIIVSFDGNIEYCPDGSVKQTYCVFKDITRNIIAEEKIKERELWFRTLFEEAGDFILLLRVKNKSDLEIVDINRAACSFYGYTKKELIGRSLYTITADDDAETLRNAIVPDIINGKSLTFEVDRCKKDGATCTVEARAKLVNPDEVAPLVISIERDLSESRRQKNELNLFSHGTRKILGLSNFTDTAVTLYRSVSSLIASRAGAFCLKQSDQREFTSLFIELDGTFDYAQYHFSAAESSSITQALSDRAVVFSNNLMSDEKLSFLDGPEIPLRNLLCAPLCIGDDVQGVLVLANTEVAFSEQDLHVVDTLSHLLLISLKNQRTLDALRDREEYFRHFFTNMNMGVAVYECVDEGDDFIIRDLNPASQILSKVNLADVQGKRLTKVFPGVLEMGLFDILKRCWKTGEPQVLPLTVYQDNRIREVVENKVFKLPSGLLVAMYDDKTEQHDLQKRLVQAEKMEAVGHLAGGIAHDFNNILGAIMGYTDLCFESVSPSSELAEYLDVIRISTGRARDLVRQILTFSRQNEDEKVIQYLKPIVKEVVLLMRASLPSSIEINSSFERDKLPVLANATQIHEILMNLCTNAAHAMAEKGALGVSFKNKTVKESFQGVIGTILPGNYAVMTISDTGCGIPPGQLTQIFEPFYTTKPLGEGTGMGLSVVFGIVQGHGGDMTVQSIPNEGTTFTVYLPQTNIREEEQKIDDGEIRGGNERVLFVDDEDLLCDLARSLLTGLGYSVEVFRSPLEALDRFKTAPDDFDLIVTDQTMPVMTGVELCSEIFKIKNNFPALLCTGYSKTVDEEICRNAGIGAFCLKPFNKKEIAGLIRSILE